MADDNIAQLQARWNEEQRAEAEARHDRRGKGDDNGSGTPPGGSDLEKRVAELEKANLDIREKLVRVETKLDGIEQGMATKAALAELRAGLVGEIGTIRTSLTGEVGTIRTSMVGEIGTINQSVANFRTEITRLEGTMIKWFIGTAAVLAGLAFTAAKIIN